MPNWQAIKPLNEYLDAPSVGGVYEIGFRKLGYVAPQAAAYGLHAAGYPHDFLPMYVGKHRTSIRQRLGQHFIGMNTRGRYRTGRSASASIKQYYLELLPELLEKKAQIPEDMRYPLDGLYFTCITVSDPDSFESFVRLDNFHYPWNRKDETAASEEAEGMQSADFEYMYKKKSVRFVG